MSTPSRRLLIDARYAGMHGIARYSSEIKRRLTLPWSPFVPHARPGEPRDALSWDRLRLRPDDVLYSPGYSSGYARCTQYLTLHDLIHLEVAEPTAMDRLRRAYYECVLKPIIRKARLVFTVSDTSADALRCWIGDPRVEVVNAGNGCSTVFTTDGPAASVRGAPYFLYVGNFRQHKNPEPVFHGLRQVPDARLVVVTNDVTAARLMAVRASIEDRVDILSSVDDEALANYYRGAVALTFPSKIEGFGLPAVEALRCGTPVIYSRQCASVHEICGGKHAVDDPDDWAEFAGAMKQVLEHREVNRVLAPEDYSWSRVAERVEAALRGRLFEVAS